LHLFAEAGHESQQNADGSTDLYLGPQLPAGKQGNWLAIIRLYGPTEAAINRSWKPSDIEKVN
jgi:hypothetical protein